MWTTHRPRPNAITHTREYRVLPGVVRYTFSIFGLFTKPNLCPPDTKFWRRHWCGIAVPALQRPTHPTHVIYVTLTIKLWTAPLRNVYTRVRAIIQVCAIARPAPQRHTLVTNVN